MKRIIIYPKDIMVLTGRSERYSREILRKIKTHHKKEKYQLVSVQEFCDFMGIKSDEVEHILKS